jgi:hypothetical protein
MVVVKVSDDGVRSDSGDVECVQVGEQREQQLVDLLRGEEREKSGDCFLALGE